MTDTLEQARASEALGAWMSAALDDPAVCDAMKADIQAWFDAGKPPYSDTLERREAIIEAIIAALETEQCRLDGDDYIMDTRDCINVIREKADAILALSLPAREVGEAENVIDLDQIAWQAIQDAAAQSNWIPPEYYRNDWVSDVCSFLRDGPAALATTHAPREMQADLVEAKRGFERIMAVNGGGTTQRNLEMKQIARATLAKLDRSA